MQLGKLTSASTICDPLTSIDDFTSTIFNPSTSIDNLVPSSTIQMHDTDDLVAQFNQRSTILGNTILF